MFAHVENLSTLFVCYQHNAQRLWSRNPLLELLDPPSSTVQGAALCFVRAEGTVHSSQVNNPENAVDTHAHFKGTRQERVVLPATFGARQE